MVGGGVVESGCAESVGAGAKQLLFEARGESVLQLRAQVIGYRCAAVRQRAEVRCGPGHPAFGDVSQPAPEDLLPAGVLRAPQPAVECPVQFRVEHSHRGCDGLQLQEFAHGVSDLVPRPVVATLAGLPIAEDIERK